MCILNGVQTLGDETGPSIIFAYPNPGAFDKYWHILPTESTSDLEQSRVIDQETSLFTPNYIQPCQNATGNTPPCFHCSDISSAHENPWPTTNSDSCRNQKFANRPPLDRRGKLGDLGGVTLQSHCPVERIFARIVLTCIFSGVRLCGSADCKRRFQLLETLAPRCKWTTFRFFVMTAVACRVPTSVLLFFVPEFTEGPNQVVQSACLDMRGVYDVWMWGVCNQNPNTHWFFRSGPSAVFMRSYQIQALETVRACQTNHGICPTRIWNIRGRRRLPNVGYIGQSVAAAPPFTRPGEHSACTDQACQLTHLSSTFSEQAHKCLSPDMCLDELVFDPEALNKAAAANRNRALAWSTTATDGSPRLCHENESYMAISHVWSDGTGVGMKPPGHVNSCLFRYFAQIAMSLGCHGLWWDAISVPSNRELRKVAIASMLDNYAKAKVTVVHDQEIANYVWRDDSGPAIAIVLSSWFTRGWTAAELFMSKSHPIKFIFSDGHGNPLIKDLDRDILARPDLDRVYTLGHLAAHDIICNIRPLLRSHLSNEYQEKEDIQRRAIMANPGYPRDLALLPEIRMVSNLTDLMSILQPRSTSWALDRMLIAGLLCLGPDELEGPMDSQKRNAMLPEMTKAILAKFGTISLTQLIHGEVPLSPRGPWSWCPQSIYDLGRFSGKSSAHIATDIRSNRIRADGSILLAAVDAHEVLDTDTIIPLSQHLAISTQVEAALSQRRKCVLITKPTLISLPMPVYLLAHPLYIFRDGLIGCQFIAWVYLHSSVPVSEETRLDTKRRRWLGELDQKHHSIFREPNDIVLGKGFINDGVASRPPMNFDLARWAVERIRVSFLTASTHGSWILFDRKIDEQPPADPGGDVGFVVVFEHRARHWPAQPIYIYPEAVSASTEPPPEYSEVEADRGERYKSGAERNTPPYPEMGVLGFDATGRREESCVSSSLFQRLSSAMPLATVKNCSSEDHAYTCHGITRLHWMFPFNSETFLSTCKHLAFCSYQTDFHIVDDDDIFAQNSEQHEPQRNVLIGRDFFSRFIEPKLQDEEAKRAHSLVGGSFGMRASDIECVPLLEACGECAACEERIAEDGLFH